MALKDWSTTAATNATVSDATYGNITFAENQSPNTVNDSARASMAHVRAFYESLEWRDWGHTVTRTGNTTFTIASATTLAAVYVVGRRIRCTDSSTLYGIISATSHNGSDTHTVTVSLDSGNLSASLASVAVGFDVTGYPFPSVIGAMTYHGAVQEITNDTWTGLSHNTGVYEKVECISSSGTPTRTVITVPSGYTWIRIVSQANFETNSTGRRAMRVVTGAEAALTPQQQTNQAPLSANTTFMHIDTGWLPVTAADTFNVQVYQDSGGALDIQAGTTWTSVEFR